MAQANVVVSQRTDNPIPPYSEGGAMKVPVTVSFSGASTYPTGGMDLTGVFIPHGIEFVTQMDGIQVLNNNTSGANSAITGRWIAAGQKLMLYEQGTADPELANGIDMQNWEIDLTLVSPRVGDGRVNT